MYEKLKQCRTCFSSEGDGQNLESFSPLFPDKTFSQLLIDVAKIEPSESSLVPNQICYECLFKLQETYSFILQIQKLDKKWKSLERRKSLDSIIEENLEKECLEEAPIDIPQENLLNIKEEKSLDDVPMSEVSTTNADQLLKSNFSFHLENENENDFILTPDQEEIESDKESDDPITLEHYDANESFQSYEDDNQAAPSTSRGRPRKKRGRPRLRDIPNFDDNIQANENGRFVCPICDKDFAWRKDLQRHYQTHFNTEVLTCGVCEKAFLRKDKFKEHQKLHLKENPSEGLNNKKSNASSTDWPFGNHLYSEKPFILRQCKLCEMTFTKTSLLRQHLEEHNDIKKLHVSLDLPLVKEHFLSDSNNMENIKLNIVTKLQDKEIGQFYLIRNHFGYEMALSDSESDSDHEDDNENTEDLVGNEKVKKYFCIICQKFFSRKHQIFSHMRETHKYDILPYKCSSCKIGFSSELMFHQHLKAQCRNKLKKLKCSKCPGRFVWLESLNGHRCSHRFSRKSSEKLRNLSTASPIQCDLCEMSFKRLSQLQLHKKNLHNSEEPLQECHLCYELFASKEKLEEHQQKEHEKIKKRIQCSLCCAEFEKLSTLREHLNIHADGSNQCQPHKGLFFTTFHPQANIEELRNVAQQISSDFRNYKYFRYFFAADEEGNELDLYDSDTEEEDDQTTETNSTKYICELCLDGFSRLKSVLEHQQSVHSSGFESLPQHCQRCNQGFVSFCLLERHLRKDCNESLPISFRCKECNISFIWLENYNKHLQKKHLKLELHHQQQQQQQQQQDVSGNAFEQDPNDMTLKSLQCNTCGLVFITLSELSQHQLTHSHYEAIKFDCPFCNQHFNQKESLQEHLKTHANTQLAAKKEARIYKPNKYTEVDLKICKPHGCKHIQCMICLSKHSKISDLRVHLLDHENNLPTDKAQQKNLKDLLEQLYPNELNEVSMEEFIQHIKSDIQAKNFDLFYSITNEVGYELQLSSSETESDAEEDEETGEGVGKNGKETKRCYNCELCEVTFKRKYLLFKHQRNEHEWQEAEYCCNHCQGRFVCEELLNHHYATQCKNSKKKFSCRRCPLRFMWQDNFKNHLQQHADEEANQRKSNSVKKKSFECIECNRSFVMLKDLTRHMVMHDSTYFTLTCHWCPRKFYRKANLIMHIQRHGIPEDQLDYAESMMKFYYRAHGQKNVFCKVCKVQFNKISTLRQHLQQENSLLLSSHHNYHSMLNYSITNELGFELTLNDSETDEESFLDLDKGTNQHYSCEICHLSFKRKYQVALHQQSVHKYEKLPLKCGKCIFKTVSSLVLAYHETSQCLNAEKQHECPKCSFKFMWPENLSNHIRLLHQSESLENSAHSKGKVNKKTEFQCDFCTAKYTRKDRLNAHLHKAHKKASKAKVNNNSKTMDSTSSSTTSSSNSTHASDLKKRKNDKKFLCAFCGKAVTSSSNLIIHMRRHTGEKPFKCDFCDMAFPRSSDLQCHRRTHTGEKPHKCTVCEKAFARSYKLQQHMRIHSGERPYKCTYCEKSFAQSNDLTLHIRRHTGERPYICGVCGERFIQGTALKNHRLMRGHFEEVEQPKSRAILEQF